MRRRNRRFLLLTLALALGGCSTQPIPVNLPVRSTRDARPPIDARPLVLLPVLDERPRRDNDSAEMTQLGALVTTTHSVTAWVEEETRRQFSTRFLLPAETAADTREPVPTAQLAIKDCYVHSVRGHPSAQVILEIRRFENGRELDRRIVRGQCVGSVWVSFRSEIAHGLRRALEDAVGQAAAELETPWPATTSPAVSATNH